jgi:VWFA-related protein
MLKSGLCGSMALLFLLLVPFHSALAQQQQPDWATLPFVVRMVDVGATVTDSNGKFVDGLTHEDFEVLDNGVAQPIRYFALDQPSHVLLLIEAGPAVYLLEGGHLTAAFALLAGLSAEDQVAVVKYAEKPEAICDFSADKQMAAGALEHLNFNLGFGALNLSESMGTVLDWMGKTPGKKTLVLLSTGLDTSAPTAATGLLQRLRVGGVRVLAVSLAGEMRTPAAGKKKSTPSKAAVLTAQQFAEADEVLKQLAGTTGGRAYFPANTKEFGAAYAEIVQIVRHEYSLGFSPEELDGKVHRIEVRVMVDDARARGLRVNNRQGYVATRE